MNKFCHNCGKQMGPGFKLCPYCGTDLASLVSKAASAPAVVIPNKAQGQFTPFSVGKEDDDDKDSYLDKLQHLDIRQDSLHVEIIRDRPLGETVGALVAQALQSNQPPESYSPRPSPFANSEAFLKEFKQEAGTMRMNEK